MEGLKKLSIPENHEGKMENTPLRKTAENLGLLIPVMGRTILKPIEVKSKNVLSPTQINILNVLKNEVEYSMGELAEQMQISNPQVTSILTPLVEKKLVKRVYDSSDRRIVKAKITDAGLKKITEFQAGMIDLITDRIRGLSNEDYEELNESIVTIKNIFEKLNR